MAEVASRRALAAAGKEPSDVDLIVLATCTGDSIIPSTAAILQDKLGAYNAAAFDLNAACSGFIYALVVASNMIRAGTHRTVLVVGSEKLHYHLDFTDRSTAVLFGDAAGAVVLEATEEPVGLLNSELGMDGSVWDILRVPKDGNVGDPGPRLPEEGGIRMNGPEVFRRAVTTMSEVAVRIHSKAPVSSSTTSTFSSPPGQRAHHRRRRQTSRASGVEGLHQHRLLRNTSAATIAVALTEALRKAAPAR